MYGWTNVPWNYSFSTEVGGPISSYKQWTQEHILLHVVLWKLFLVLNKHDMNVGRGGILFFM